jgi:hypothetical protein
MWEGTNGEKESVWQSRQTCTRGSRWANAPRYTQHHCRLGTTTRHRRDVCPVKMCTATL